LGVYQGTDEASGGTRAHPHPGLEAPSCDRDAVADVQLCRLPIYGTKSGFWMIRVVESLRRALAVKFGSVTLVSPPFRCERF
jgi:hypothetical protein